MTKKVREAFSIFLLVNEEMYNELDEYKNISWTIVVTWEGLTKGVFEISRNILAKFRENLPKFIFPINLLKRKDSSQK